MQDEGDLVILGLSPAEAAVNYLLQRIRLDVNLRHYMLHTEAFHRLCLAESHRVGKPIDEIKGTYSQPPRRLADQVADVTSLRAELDNVRKDLSDPLTEVHTDGDHDIADELLNLCPACRGLPPLSINRCPLCRVIQAKLF